MLKPLPSQVQEPQEKSSLNELPHSREAEEAVIGSVLINPDCYWDLMDIVRDEDFYIHRLRFIWVAYCTLFGSGEPVDILTVSTRLDDMGRLDEIGGQAYLTELLLRVPTTLHATAYAEMVAATSLRRQYLMMANKFAELAYDANKGIDEVSEEMERIFQGRNSTAKTTVIPANDAADELERQIDEGIAQGVPSGIAMLDETIGGYPKQGITLLFAGSSQGKTALFLQEAEAAAFAGRRVLYVTLESSTDRMVARRVFSQAGVPMKTMRNASMTPQQKADVKAKIREYKETHHRLAFDDKARTLAGIDRSIKQHLPELVVIDDLMHVKPERNNGRQSSDVTLLLEMVMRLKDIAIDRNCAILIIHTMTPAEVEKFWSGPENKRTSNVAPALDAIGWAKDILYRVDVLLGLVPDYQAQRTDNILKEILWDLKDREGETFHAVELYFNKPEQWFYDNSTIGSIDPKYIQSRPVKPAQPAQKPPVSAMASLPKPKQGALMPRPTTATPPRMDFTEPPEEDDYPFNMLE